MRGNFLLAIALGFGTHCRSFIRPAYCTSGGRLPAGAGTNSIRALGPNNILGKEYHEAVSNRFRSNGTCNYGLGK
jgi:hypothetical protein